MTIYPSSISTISTTKSSHSMKPVVSASTSTSASSSTAARRKLVISSSSSSSSSSPWLRQLAESTESASEINSGRAATRVRVVCWTMTEGWTTMPDGKVTMKMLRARGGAGSREARGKLRPTSRPHHHPLRPRPGLCLTTNLCPDRS